MNTTSNNPQTATAKPLRILVAEDSPLNQQVALKQLEKLGYAAEAVSDGTYGIPEGIMFGYPVTCSGGQYTIVKGIEHNDFAKSKIAATHKELTEERAAIQHLLK